MLSNPFQGLQTVRIKYVTDVRDRIFLNLRQCQMTPPAAACTPHICRCRWAEYTIVPCTTPVGIACTQNRLAVQKTGSGRLPALYTVPVGCVPQGWTIGERGPAGILFGNKETFSH
jgi:hypothetical protein